MEIQLTRGYKTVIDDDDFELVKGYRWVTLSTKGSKYAIATWTEDGKRHHVLMHRLLLGLNDRRTLVDHRDGNGLNNRRSNLRVCSHAENMRNSKVRKHSSTQIRNVALEKDSRRGVERIRVCIRKDGVRHQRIFKANEIAEATAWATAKRKELHGAFDAASGVGVENDLNAKASYPQGAK